jgi:hypothetical protein
MKRTLVGFAALGFMIPTTSLAVPDNEPADHTRIIVRSNDYRIVSEDDGQRIVMEGFGYRMEPGKPMLPEKDVLIALPPGAMVLGLEATGLSGGAISGIERILPAPPILPLAEPAHRRELAAELRREWLDNNRTVYASDDSYPEEIGRITGSGSLRKYAYAGVSVCPFEYRPLSGRLTHFDAVEITVHYALPPAGGPRALQTEGLLRDRAADRRASELFVNYDRIADLYRSGRRDLRPRAETYDYVIITTGSLAGAVASSDFPAWKAALGHSLNTVLVTDSEITGQPGGDLAEQIRNFLRSYYGTWGIQYVLFVGDYATVPMRYCYPNPADHTHNPGDHQNPGGSVPTDYYYADLSLPDADSWDSDGDGYPGEYLEDSPDLLAEVYVGRVPTNDLTRITYTLNKLVDFEQDQGSWKQNALLPGSILFFENQDYSGYPKVDGSTLLNEIETVLMSGWTVSHYSEQEGLEISDFAWPAVSISAFEDDWRTGQYAVVNWSGHGAPYGVVRTRWDWDDGDGVPETDGSDGISLPGLINQWCDLDDDYPSIVFAVSCHVGYPEPNGYGNLGIDLLTEPGFGASAGIVSSSRPAAVSADFLTYPGGAESMCYEFNRNGIIENDPLGKALYDAKYYCYVNYGWDHYYELMNQYNFDLYGDPALKRVGGMTDHDVPAASALGVALLASILSVGGGVVLTRRRRSVGWKSR